jgi:hypothetical protein
MTNKLNDNNARKVRQFFLQTTQKVRFSLPINLLAPIECITGCGKIMLQQPLNVKNAPA